MNANTTNHDVPVVMLAFANDHVSDRRYLRALDDEEAGIRSSLEPLVERGVVAEPHVLSNATVERVQSAFLTRRLAGRITVFHFGGHATGSSLVLGDGAGGMAPSHSGGLARFLGGQRGLGLVVLNGCCTQDQVALLREHGVKAVVATSRAIEDAVASRFATVFYQALALHPLRKAFDLAEAAIQNQKGSDPRASLRSEYRETDLGGPQWSDRWPWVLDCTAQAEDWMLVPAPNKTPRSRHGIPGRLAGVAGLATLAAGAAWIERDTAETRSDTASQSEADPPIGQELVDPVPRSEPEPPVGMRWVSGGKFLQGSSRAEWRAAYEACRDFFSARKAQTLHKPGSVAWDPNNCTELTWAREHRVHSQVAVEPFFLDVNEATIRQVAAWLDQRLAARAIAIDGDFIIDADGKVWGKLREDAVVGRPAVSQIERTNDGTLHPVPGRGEHPMALATWQLADAYCRDRGARLPSEAEWEWAARGVERTDYPWANTKIPACSDAMVDRVADGECADDGRGPVPVGAGAQDVSWAGIRDMGGSVAEWVADEYVDETPVPAGGTMRERGARRRCNRCSRVSPVQRRELGLAMVVCPQRLTKRRRDDTNVA